MKILFVVLPVCDAWSRTLDANVQVAPMSKQGNKEMVEFWLLHNKKLFDPYRSRIIPVSRVVTA